MKQPSEWADLTVRSTSNGVVTTDADGRIALINTRAEEILKLPPGSYTGRRVEEIMPVSAPMVRRCLDEGTPVIGYQARGEDEEDTIVINITPIEADNLTVGAVCNFQSFTSFDATARQLSSFKQIHRQLRAVIDSSSDGIFVCDGRGTILNMNRASEELSGMDGRKFIGRNIRALLKEGLIDQSVTLEVLRTGRAVNRMVNVKRTGKQILITGTPVLDENGDIDLVVLNERDMTQLNRIREELHQVIAAKERFREELSVLNLAELEHNGIVAESESMRHVVRSAMKLAGLGCSNILITGESGTGKGLMSKFIHNSGPRKQGPFIHINCAALPETLLEAELFGYERGAFTGADQKGKPGLLELANEGTVFLDELGDMPLATQTKLLKYLDDGVVMRLGGTREIALNSAVIAATNHDLPARVRQKTFRRDLYYRLNVFHIHIPPLRQRPEDILVLIRHFLKRFNLEYRRNCHLGHRAVELLGAYAFPGNVRELINLTNKAVALSDCDDIYHFLRSALLEDELGRKVQTCSGEAIGFHVPGESNSLKERLGAHERRILLEALSSHGTTRAMAAALGLNQSTVVRKLAKHGLRKLDA